MPGGLHYVANVLYYQVPTDSSAGLYWMKGDQMKKLTPGQQRVEQNMKCNVNILHGVFYYTWLSYE